MKGLLFSLFAIGLAGFAALAATTLFLNTPVRAPIEGSAALSTQTSPSPPSADSRSVPPLSVDAPAPAAGATPAPGPAPAPDGAKPPAGDAAADEEGPDKDPYEGIAPEELPPDLQYNADSSVSFPTNI